MAEIRRALPNSLRTVREGLRLISEHSNETRLITEILAVELGLQKATYGRMLDIGCGFGRFSVALGPHVQSVVLLEPDDVMLKSAARQLRKIRKPVELLCCRVEDVMARDEWRFDLIMLSHILYYTADWRMVVDRCVRWLTGTGRLVIVLWSCHSDLFRHRPQPIGSEPDVTSEAILRHLEHLGVATSAAMIEPTICVSSSSLRRTLVRFMGYSRPEEIARVAETQLAKTPKLVDRQQVIVVRP